MAPKVNPKNGMTAAVEARWRKVREAIRRESGAYNQGTFGDITEYAGHKPTCDSPACLAGWFHHFTPKAQRAGDAEGTVMATLPSNFDPWTITHSEAEDWPEPFRTDFKRAAQSQLKARIAARRITFLLRTGR